MNFYVDVERYMYFDLLEETKLGSWLICWGEVEVGREESNILV